MQEYFICMLNELQSHPIFYITIIVGAVCTFKLSEWLAPPTRRKIRKAKTKR